MEPEVEHDAFGHWEWWGETEGTERIYVITPLSPEATHLCPQGIRLIGRTGQTSRTHVRAIVALLNMLVLDRLSGSGGLG